MHAHTESIFDEVTEYLTSFVRYLIISNHTCSYLLTVYTTSNITLKKLTHTFFQYTWIRFTYQIYTTTTFFCFLMQYHPQRKNLISWSSMPLINHALLFLIQLQLLYALIRKVDKLLWSGLKKKKGGGGAFFGTFSDTLTNLPKISVSTLH